MTSTREDGALTRPRLALETPSVIDVFTEVLKRGPIARIDVARRTGLSQSAVTKAMAPLLGRGLLFSDGSAHVSSPGRPPQPISVNEEAQLVLGVVLRVDEIYGVATTIRANILHSVRRPLPGPSVSAAVDGIAMVVEHLRSRLGEAADKVMGVGVTVSGDIDAESGTVRISPRMNWSDVPLADLLQARLGAPVVVDNDVRALSIAEEWFGIGVDVDSFAIVTIGTGIGCGLYLNGDVVEGAHGVAGEIGHLPLAPGGIPCSCGRRGCVETVASSAAILSSIRDAQRDPELTMREAVQLARDGNQDAIAALRQAAAIIGTALATMANLVGPGVIVVMGESVTDYDLYEQKIRQSFEEHTFGSAGQCKIITRSHTFEDWARGAAASVIRTAVTEAIADRSLPADRKDQLNMMSRITSIEPVDIRFPTSRTLDGSDAMNPDPDYSAAYVRVRTDSADGLTGHGFVFTIGKGNDLEVAAIRTLGTRLVGRNVEELLDDMGATWRELVHDSQPRWLGPEKGVVHMAIGALVNALWDLKAKRAGLPLWRLLAAMSPEEIVSLVDFRYLTDALSPGEALALLADALPGREERLSRLLRDGYPAYTTAPGWLGYDDAKLARLCRQAVDEGFTQVKLKVGANLEEDIRRLRIAREVVGPDVKIAIDANQRWDVGEAVEWIGRLAPFDLAWIEEPTSPDDVLGHAAIARAVSPVPVATGEHVANRIMFKQFLQARGLQVLQMDATRVAGVNENVAILLLAAKFGVPVCPHAGGVGLCEQVQHFSMFDFVAVSGTTEGRTIEYIDHLHEHFVIPADVRGGRYWPPLAPGIGSEMLPASVKAYEWSGGQPGLPTTAAGEVHV